MFIIKLNTFIFITIFIIIIQIYSSSKFRDLLKKRELEEEIRNFSTLKKGTDPTIK